MEAGRQATSRGTSDIYLKSRLIRLAYYVAGPQADTELALPLSHA